jgi:hypothetical protein
VGVIMEKVRCLSTQIFAGNAVLAGLADGSEPTEVATGWLLESYFYTALAEWHIGPVLNHPLGLEERLHWLAFYEEERTHYRIYQELFQEMGWDSGARLRMQPMDETFGFISTLRDQSKKSSPAYAGVILLMEQALDAKSLEADPLFGVLCKQYGFSRKAIRPLFEHSRANGSNGHSELGAQIMARRPWIPSIEAEEILGGIDRLVQALDAWYQALGRNYRNPAFFGSRFREVSARRLLASPLGRPPSRDRPCT